MLIFGMSTHRSFCSGHVTCRIGYYYWILAPTLFFIWRENPRFIGDAYGRTTNSALSCGVVKSLIWVAVNAAPWVVVIETISVVLRPPSCVELKFPITVVLKPPTWTVVRERI